MSRPTTEKMTVRVANPDAGIGAEGAQIPELGWVLELFGMTVRSAPFNITFLLALAAAKELSEDIT